MLDVVQERMGVETLRNVAWNAVAPDADVVACTDAAFAADSDMVAGPGALFAAGNEPGCEEC